MKKLIIMMLLISTGIVYSAEYRDGVYRGVFISGQETQVEVQFKLKDDIVENTRLRTLFYKGNDYLKNKELKEPKERYQNALKSTEGKNIKEALETLYYPEDIPRAGATVRASKIRGAMQNALNSGVYKLEK